MAQLRILLCLACLGVSVCAACGSSFTGGGSAGGGNAGEAAGPSDAGSGNSAASNSAGDAGETSAGSGGTSASAGSTSAGAAGKDGTAGAGGSGAGAGGSSAGAAGKGGGAGSGGSAGSAGSGGAPDCKTLEAEYTPLLEKARVCDKGSTDQCSASSKLNSIGSCGCPVLVNATSAATTAAQKKYKELEDNKCLSTGVMCGAVCLAPKVVSCAQQMSGTGNAFVCTAGSIVVN